MAARKPSEFQWYPFDTIIARAFGVILDASELQALAACICAFPSLDASNHCMACKRKFVFDHNRRTLPAPPAEPPAETE